MNDEPRRISLDEWDDRYTALQAAGMQEPAYGGPLRRHLECGGDLRLAHLRFDNSPASLQLWNFLLTEEERLHQARREGKKIVGAMKDLGTVPVMAYSLPDLVAFYPDGAWWIPCIMELSAGLLQIADSMGVDDSFCPVRAMLGAFENKAHFPIPDLLICSTGAVCDDFSAIAQRLEGMGHAIHWWEIPHRRDPEPGETAVRLPGGLMAPESQVTFVKNELERIRRVLESISDYTLDETALSNGIKVSNRIRRMLTQLRQTVFQAPLCPLPALEMQIAEMLAIHFCSDRGECICVLKALLDEAFRRIGAGQGILPADAVRVFWINPVADLRVVNLLEDCGGRLCGSDYFFCHALDTIPEEIPPMEALARTALADVMAGPSRDRADRINREIELFGAECAVISRIPGASHCAFEGRVICETIQARFDIPVLEIETPPLTDAMQATLQTRLEALVETVKWKRL